MKTKLIFVLSLTLTLYSEPLKSMPKEGGTILISIEDVARQTYDLPPDDTVIVKNLTDETLSVSETCNDNGSSSTIKVFLDPNESTSFLPCSDESVRTLTVEAT